MGRSVFAMDKSLIAYRALLIVHEMCKRVQTNSNIPTYRGSHVYILLLYLPLITQQLTCAPENSVQLLDTQESEREKISVKSVTRVTRLTSVQISAAQTRVSSWSRAVKPLSQLHLWLSGLQIWPLLSSRKNTINLSTKSIQFNI